MPTKALTDQERQVLTQYGRGADVADIATAVGWRREYLGQWLINVCSLNRAAARVMARDGARPVRSTPPVQAAPKRRNQRQRPAGPKPVVPEPVEVVTDPAPPRAEPDPEPAIVEEPVPAPAEPEPAAAVETDRQRVERVTAGVLLDHLPGAAAVLEAARAWVAAIRDDPRTWADREDLALIDAVRALDGSTLPPYAPAVPNALAEYGAHRCPACGHLGQPDGHTGCGGELEPVTVAILRGPR